MDKWEKWRRFSIGLGVQDWFTTCAAPVNILEVVIRVEEDGSFMERWRTHSGGKWRFAGIQADTCVKVSLRCPGISNLLVEWSSYKASFKDSGSQDVFKLHMGITLQCCTQCHPTGSLIWTICFHIVSDVAKWISVLLLGWLQHCFSIEEIVLTIYTKEGLKMFVGSA